MQLFHHFLTNEECDHIIKVVELLQCAYCGCWDGAHGKSALASADGKAAQLGPELAPASAKAAHRPSPPQIASPHIARSTVVNPDGSISDDPIRTSWGTFLSRAQDEVVFAIEQRIANWTHLPVSHAGQQGAAFCCRVPLVLLLYVVKMLMHRHVLQAACQGFNALHCHGLWPTTS